MRSPCVLLALPLADTEDRAHALVDGILELGGPERVVIKGEDAELAPSLGVAKQDLRDTHVLHLLHGHLGGEGAAAPEIHVLWGDQCTIGKLVAAASRVEDRRAHVDLALMLAASSSSFYTLPPTIDVHQALLQLTQHVLELMVGLACISEMRALPRCRRESREALRTSGLCAALRMRLNSVISSSTVMLQKPTL